jgi:hypothetical protein
MSELPSSRVDSIVTPILNAVLHGVDRIEYADDVDHDGDPIIRATIYYRVGAPRPKTEAFLDAVIASMAALAREGDRRFLHFWHLHADGEPAAEPLLQSVRKRRRA